MSQKVYEQTCQLTLNNFNKMCPAQQFSFLEEILKNDVVKQFAQIILRPSTKTEDNAPAPRKMEKDANPVIKKHVPKNKEPKEDGVVYVPDDKRFWVNRFHQLALDVRDSVKTGVVWMGNLEGKVDGATKKNTGYMVNPNTTKIVFPNGKGEIVVNGSGLYDHPFMKQYKQQEQPEDVRNSQITKQALEFSWGDE